MTKVALQQMALARARVALYKITWRRKGKTGNDSSAAVPSSAVRSPLEREPWALDCWPASEPQKQVAAFHREMRHCFASQRRSSYSRPTFGYNTTNSAASRITK